MSCITVVTKSIVFDHNISLSTSTSGRRLRHIDRVVTERE
jgi:hypothetical protein